MEKLKNLYNYSPRFLRNIYINIYGIKNIFRFRKRDRLLKEIEYTEKLDKETQINLVEKKLKGIIEFAIKNVPFYTNFSSLGKDLNNKSIYNILKEFPIINKETINREPDAFLSKKHSNYVISKTSGTTGTPLSVYVDKFTFRLIDALGWRRTKWAGYEKGDWIARLVGDPIIPLRVKNPKKPWIISRFDKRIYLSTFHLNRNNARKMGELLNKLQPAFIMGYPSSLEILCSYLSETKFRLQWNPKSILFSSEPMYSHQEKIIRSIFKERTRHTNFSAR
jgi:phenylacetate-CoA ligase